MAETATLGKLVVQMLLDPSKWEAGVQAVQASAKTLVDGIQRTAQVVSNVLGQAMSSASDDVEDLSKSLDVVADAAQGTTPAMAQAAHGVDGVSSAVQGMAGVFKDASGRLRDAKGRFLEEKDVLRLLENQAGLTEQQIQDLTDAQEKLSKQRLSESAQELTGRLQSLGSVIQDVLVTGLKAATAAAAGLAAASAYVGVQFEQKMTAVGVIAGANTEQMQALNDEARRLGATTVFSSSEAADAMHVLASAGLDTQQIIEATGKALVLAGSSGVGLDLAASTLASTMNQFGLKADQASRIVDVLAKATASSQFEVDDLSEALKYAAPTAASFGYSLEDTVAVLAQFRDLGLQGSVAGTALRSVLSQASQQTKINADTLAKYGLELSDVNPQLHTFAEILDVVGKAQMSTADAMVVFGVESGGALATLAEQAATGSTALDDMRTSLLAAGEGAGAATDMYNQMQQTVAGALSEVQDSGENVLLTLYDQYKTTIPALLQAIADFVNGVSDAIGDRALEIQDALGSAFGEIEAYLEQNGQDLASLFAQWVAEAARFVGVLVDVGTKLADLLPYLEAIAETMGVIWVATKVASFASALSEVVELLSAAEAGVAALGVELTVMSGGTFALVAALGTLVVGLGAVIDRYLEAADAAKQLKDAQDALAAKQKEEDQTRIAELDAILERQQAGLAGKRQELAAAGQLTNTRKAELEMLERLSAADAARLEAQGKLIQVGGELRSVASVVEAADLYDQADGYNAIQARIDALQQTASSAKTHIADLQDAIRSAQQIEQDGGNPAQVAAMLTNALGESISTIGAAEARLADLQQRRRDASNEANALDQERSKYVTDILNKNTQAEKDAYHAGVVAHAAANDDKLQADKDYTLGLRNLHAAILDESRSLDVDITGSFNKELGKRRRAIETEAQHEIEAAKGNAEKIAKIKAEEQSALTDLDALGERERAAQRAQDEAKHAQDIKDERTRLQAELRRFQQADMKESERLEQEKSDALAGISSANVDLMVQIAEQYNKKIAEAREKEAADAKKAADDLAVRHKENAKKVADAVISAFKSAADAIGSALEGAYGLLESFASKVYDVFSTITGFSFDLAGLVSDVASAMTDAADSGTSVSVTDAAQSAISDLLSEADTLLATFVEAAPILLEGLSAGLPDLIDQFLADVPTIAQAVLAEVPTIVQTIADALPGLVQVVVALLPDIADALLDVRDTLVPAVIAALPDLIQGFVSVASGFVQEVLALLPDIVDGLLALLPDLIRGVLAELPALIQALLSAATDVVVSIIKALPGLVEAILEALPDILTALIEGLVEALPVVIEALVEALPDLIIAILEAVPTIVEALVSELPTIITALVGLLPVVIEGIVARLPDLIDALIGSTGDIVSALVAAAPEIAVALVEAVVSLIADLPELAAAIGSAFVEGIKSAAEAIYDALVNVFSSAWDAITSLFGGGSDSKDSHARSASSARTGAPDVATLLGLSALQRLPDLSEYARAEQEAQRRPAAGTTGQGSTARVQVVLNGRTVQDVLAVSDARGETTFRSQRATGSAKVGISRGRYNRYSK